MYQALLALVFGVLGTRAGVRRVLLVQNEAQAPPMPCQRHVYLDLGVNWANTLRLYEMIAPPERRSRAFEVYGFKASPLISPYADAFCAWLSGERPTEAPLCLPRAGSTGHLLLYAASIGCREGSMDTKRACMLERFDEHLRALKPDPNLNSTALFESRLAMAQHQLACGANQSRFTFVPAAVGGRGKGWMSLESPPHALIRGGSMQAIAAIDNRLYSKSPWYRLEDYRFRVRTADVAAWMARSFRKEDFIVVKADVEGAEHVFLPELIRLGGIELVDTLAMECHGGVRKCRNLLKAVSVGTKKDGFQAVDEGGYQGMDVHSRPPPPEEIKSWAALCGVRTA
jgi:hypothetical protein